MTLFLAHTWFPELFYLQELPFVPGVHNNMHKFLHIVDLMKGNRAKALGIYCPATIWFSVIALRLTFFNLKSCKRQITIYDKATEEEDRNNCNKYVCYKPDALWPYWRSVGTFAMHVAMCCKICEKDSNSVEMHAKDVSKMWRIFASSALGVCSDAE